MADITTQGLTRLYLQVPTLAEVAAIASDPSGVFNYWLIFLLLIENISTADTYSREVRKVNWLF